MGNNVYIDFDVRSLSIIRSARSREPIPSGNQNHIFARFTFTSDWDGLNRIAVFSRNNQDVFNVPIVDSVCPIPNEMLATPGTITVSVFGGDRRTVNSVALEVVQSGFKQGLPPSPPEPNSLFVQSPDSTIPFIREYDGDFEYFAFGEWNRIEGTGGKSGYDGWTPVFALVQDGERDIIRIINWTGGGGVKPATGYLGPSGIVGNISQAVNIRGNQGELGQSGEDGFDGKSATIEIGNTTTLPAGSFATVENIGSDINAILEFGIPQGIPGSGGGSGGSSIINATASISTINFSIIAPDARTDPAILVFTAPAPYSASYNFTLNGNNITVKSHNGEPINKPWIKNEKVNLLYLNGFLYFNQGSDPKPKNMLPNRPASTYISGITVTAYDDGSVRMRGTATATVEISTVGTYNSAVSYGVIKAGRQYYFDPGLESAYPSCTVSFNYGLSSARAITVRGIFTSAVDLNINYCRYSIPNGTNLDITVKPAIYEVISPENIPWVFPDIYRVPKGELFELYYSPFNAGITLQTDSYVSGIGNPQTRKWVIPTAAETSGVYDSTLYITRNAQDIVKKQFQITVFDKPVSPLPKKVLMIGDSLTNNALPSSQLIADKATSDFGSNPFEFVGTLGTVPYRHEGRSGWTTSDYVTNKAGNPFWNADTSAVSFAYYTQQTGIQPDIVNVMLGTNDIIISSISLQASISNLKKFLDIMKIDWPNSKIMLSIPPMLGSQSGLNAAAYRGRETILRGRGILYASYIVKQFAGESRISIVPVYYCFDSEYNYSTIQETANPFVTNTVTVQSESIHPTPNGMRQIGAIWYWSLLSLIM